MIEQLASSAAKGAIDLQVSAANQRLQSKHYKEHQDYLAAVERRNAAQTYQTAVRSLNEAGLNPAIAAGANTMQTATAPSTSGNPTAGEMNPEQSMIGSRKSLMRKEEELHDNQMQVGESTIALNDANSNKAYSDALLADEQRRGEKLKNDRFAETNGIVNEQFGAFLSYLIKGAEDVGDKKRAESLNNLLMMWNSTSKHDGATYGLGALDAVNAINSAMLADSDKYAKMMDNVVRNSVNQATLKDKKVLGALVSAPIDKKRAIYSQIAETNKQIALMDEQMKNLGASTALTEEQQKNIEAQTRKIEQDIIKIGREAASIYYSDPHQMYNEGDYFHLGTFLLGEQIKFQQDVIKSAAGAATFGAFTRGAGGAARGVSAAPAAPASGVPSRIPPQAPKPSNAPPVPLSEQNAAFGRKLQEVKHRKGSASVPPPAPRGVRKSSNEHLQGEIVFMNGKPYFWENGNWRELKSWK